jgi:hypothetical protein
MPMLLFMPWCILDKPCDLGEMEILPFERDAALADCDDAVLRDLNRLLAAYKSQSEQPNQNAAAWILRGSRGLSLTLPSIVRE